ncbi:unnamed protein product [Schistosoma curassoni]|uniref:Uncharacterized protein n=1 Tax=Schistosoma curassoni TaxID=6186 RepID=A0A183JZR9_9TREM|nr:unnamed protein product [Schistosoma curassoni]
MVVGGSQQETLDPGFVLLGTRQQGVKKPKEKRKIKEHIMPRNGDRHEKNEQQLDSTRKKGPGQSGLENAGQRSMIHWE